MSAKDIEHIWNDQDASNDENGSVSLNQIRETTVRFSAENILSGRKLIIFDTVYKSLVLAGYIILLVIGTVSTAKVIFTASMILCLAYLIYRNRKLYADITDINESEPVMSVLKKRYDALLVFYPEYFYNSSITNPLFVFAGFQFYHIFRYGEDGFSTLLSDPVTYIFLGLAFIITYIAQKVSYKWMIDEMENILDMDHTELEEELRIIRIETQRRRRRIIFIFTSLLGLALLITLLLIMK